MKNGLIDNEKEYWEEHEKFKTRLKTQMKLFRKDHNLEPIKQLFLNAETIGLFSKEQTDIWLKRMKMK